MSIANVVTRGIGPDANIAGVITYGFLNAVNSSPTDITLSSSTVSVSGGSNAVVGVLIATDPDIGDSHTFTLVAGTGDTNNASFNINSAQLRCNDPSVLGIGSYSVRIQADDGASTPFAKALSVSVVAASVQGGLITNPIDDIISQPVKSVVR